VRRTIPLLSGLAILGVIFNHANWHALRDFVPGDPAGYPYILTDQIGKFAIVAFLFIAGYFSAYATSGGKKDLSWNVVRARLMGLLWPWLIWSIFFTLAQTFQGRAFSLEELLRNLFIQYYFIPLLMFYYLLAPGVARWARTNARSLLITAAIIQLVGIGVFYLRVYWSGFPPEL
jgi:fucose 4-O-acetylase-like acetyltransferase